MRSFSLCVLAVLFLGSCKHSQGPVSEPEYAVSPGGTTMTAVNGEKQGICIIQSLSNDPQSATLVTKRGAISDKQLKKTLRFMGYGEQMITAILSYGVATGGAVAAAAGSVGGVAVAFTAVVGGMAYRIIRGNVEGEKAAPIAVQSILQGLIGSPVVEYFQRDGRLRKVLSDKEQWTVTDRKMSRLLKRLGNLYPDYPAQCDHLDLEKTP